MTKEKIIFSDPIVEEVRANRQKILEKYDNNLGKYGEVLAKKQEEKEKLGFKYVSRSPNYLNNKQAA